MGKAVLLFFFASLLFGCADQAVTTGRSDTTGGSLTTPVTVQKIEYGSVCNTPYGSCIANQPGIVDTVCTCELSGGSAMGKVSP